MELPSVECFVFFSLAYAFEVYPCCWISTWYLLLPSSIPLYGYTLDLVVGGRPEPSIQGPRWSHGTLHGCRGCHGDDLNNGPKGWKHGFLWWVYTFASNPRIQVRFTLQNKELVRPSIHHRALRIQKFFWKFQNPLVSGHWEITPGISLLSIYIMPFGEEHEEGGTEQFTGSAELVLHIM